MQKTSPIRAFDHTWCGMRRCVECLLTSLSGEYRHTTELGCVSCLDQLYRMVRQAMSLHNNTCTAASEKKPYVQTTQPLYSEQWHAPCQHTSATHPSHMCSTHTVLNGCQRAPTMFGWVGAQIRGMWPHECPHQRWASPTIGGNPANPGHNKLRGTAMMVATTCRHSRRRCPQ